MNPGNVVTLLLLLSAATAKGTLPEARFPASIDQVQEGVIALDVADYPTITLPATVCPECKEGQQVDVLVEVIDGELVIDLKPNAARTKEVRDQIRKLREELTR